MYIYLMKKYERYLQIGGLMVALFSIFLIFVTPALGQDNELIDSATLERGEPECNHTGEFGTNGFDSTATDTTVATALVETEPLVEEEVAAPGVTDFLFIPKYFTFFGVMILGLILLFGRWVNLYVRIGVMLLSFVLFGLDLIYPLHPSPMCGFTKLFMFKFTWGEFFPAFTAIFLAMIVPSLIGRKLFCGWVCPLGAMQELINKIPIKFKIKQFNFVLFNGIRMALFVLFFMTFVWVRDHIAFLAERLGADSTEQMWVAFSSYSVYEPLNMFHLLHWDYTDTYFIIGFIIIFLTSLILYRPFCYMVCPIGAFTWLLERIAPGRIRIDHEACTECGDCYEASPCPTIKPMVEQSMKVLPDCTSCGECAKSCPENAIKFGFMK